MQTYEVKSSIWLSNIISCRDGTGLPIRFGVKSSCVNNSRATVDGETIKLKLENAIASSVSGQMGLGRLPT